MWKSLRRYYNYETREFVFSREIFNKYKSIIRTPRTKKFWEFRAVYDGENLVYILYRKETKVS